MNHFSKLTCKPTAVAVLLLWLAGCASVPEPSQPANAGRYSIEQDRAPSEPLNPARIEEVVPVPETRTLAGNRSPYTVNGQRYRVMDSEAGYEATGMASWYGEKFHGHRTSNGEIYDMYQVSAAHRSLPIPSYLRVTNLENDRSIVVRVNDRGPFHSDRIIDLSYAAAWKLGFADSGTAPVRLEAIVPESGPYTTGRGSGGEAGEQSSGRFLQAGAFADRDSAEQLSDRLAALTGERVFITRRQPQGSSPALYRVRLGPFDDPARLSRISDMLEAAEFGEPYVINN